MRQNFNFTEQGPSHSGKAKPKPQTLVHFKDPNFSREGSYLNPMAHVKRRTDATVYAHDYLSKWKVGTHDYKPVLGGRSEFNLFQNPKFISTTPSSHVSPLSSAKFGGTMDDRRGSKASSRGSYMAAT